MAKVSLESAQAFVAILGAAKDRAVARLSSLLSRPSIDSSELRSEMIRHEAAHRTFWAAKTIVDQAQYSGATEFDETILDVK